MQMSGGYTKLTDEKPGSAGMLSAVRRAQEDAQPVTILHGQSIGTDPRLERQLAREYFYLTVLSPKKVSMWTARQGLWSVCKWNRICFIAFTLSIFLVRRDGVHVSWQDPFIYCGAHGDRDLPWRPARPNRGPIRRVQSRAAQHLLHAPARVLLQRGDRPVRPRVHLSLIHI